MKYEMNHEMKNEKMHHAEHSYKNPIGRYLQKNEPRADVAGHHGKLMGHKSSCSKK